MPSKVDRDIKHDRAVRDIAAARFEFPTREYPNFRTFVNEPQPEMGVRGLEGEALYPDIVVVEQPRNVVRIIAEVETAQTVTEEEAEREWKLFSELCEAFYLYVPAGWSDEAKRICKKLRIRVAGLRTWRHILGADQIDITDVY